MNEEHRPTLLRVTLTDFLAFFCAVLVIVLWGFFLFDLFRNEAVSLNFTITIAAITFVGILVVLWRYSLFLTAYNEGFQAEATISEIYFFRGRGRVTYVYIFRGEKYISSNAIIKNGRTKDIRVGEAVTVFVDGNNPKKAFIARLYKG